ncbi:MAG: DUF4340 domain-containing protein [Lewinellaceae bacterium]|nr:DUF4340 domain-containing protein [Phaeodactylibacter sp.]MCB0615781.1 DUF4340 domain-containing protein [Phaeodactylibacter sp.]MCB9350149.1 DUF4340 domain-containing protein [Lewinellaceae bacterium]
MNRTLVLLIAFLLLGGGVFWYLSQGKDEKTTLAGADRDFAVKDIGQVYKIFIADRRGERTTLERKDGYWLYNGQYKARPSVMQPLLEAIARVQIKYQPPQAAMEKMVEALATEGIKVELYDKEGNLLKAYYVGGSTSDERGTYMIMEGAEQPYVAHLPFWEGNLSVRFRRYGDEWRDKTLFSEEVDNIQSVSIEYPKQRNQSFILENTPDGYEIRPFYDITPEIRRPFKEGSAEAFLINFERVGAEAFRNNYEGRDSISRLVPFSIITLVNKQGDTTQVKLHPIVKENIISQDAKSGEYVLYSSEIERYFADLNGKDFLLAQHLVLEKLFWGYSSFFQDKNLLN